MRISDWSSDVCSSDLGARAVPLGFAVEDVCLWRSAQDGNFYAIAVGEGGRIDQQLVFTSADGKVDARQARQFNLASEAKHCVADDRSGELYIADEEAGIWRRTEDSRLGTECVRSCRSRCLPYREKTKNI